MAKKIARQKDGVEMEVEVFSEIRQLHRNERVEYSGERPKTFPAHRVPDPLSEAMLYRQAELFAMAADSLVFKKGRKLGTGGPIRKALAKLLAASPDMKNSELWDVMKGKPPRGWTFCENHLGKYIEGPNPRDEMKFPRFCNVASEERKKLRSQFPRVSEPVKGA